MILRYLSTLLIFSAFAICAENATNCRPISGDQVIGRDLATAVPELATLPPDSKFGYAPAPGAQRIFTVPQLRQIATRYGIAEKVESPVCFTWPLHLLTKREIVTSLQKTLADRKADLEIVQQSLSPVPEGEVVFPLSGLSGESSKPAVWNGYIVYAGTRKFTTWVQVRIIVHEDQIVAVRAIRTGELIDRSAVTKLQYVGPLRRSPAIQKEDDVAGKCARFPIAAQTVLSESMLSLPKDVDKEQIVTVHIDCGSAHIETQGIANEAGYRGEIIKVRNPKTGRVFRAKIEDRGFVTVVPGGSVGLVVEEKKS